MSFSAWAPDHEQLKLSGIPPRSVLFSIPPLGLGSWRVESLPGYLRRIADAHSISVEKLARIVLGSSRSAAGEVKLPSVNQAFWNGGLGGTGRNSSSWVEGLRPLLISEEAIGTTLLPLKGRIARRDQLSKGIRHCPDCSREDDGKGQRYRYLIWDIQTVVVCPEHKCRLEDHKSDIEYRRAHWRLIEPFKPSGRKREQYERLPREFDTSIEIQRSLLVAQLLGSPFMRRIHAVSPESSVSGFLQTAAQRMVGGVTNQLRRHLQIGKANFQGWTTGTQLPSFGTIVDIALAMNCSIESVLTGDSSQLPLFLPEPILRKQKEKRIPKYLKESEFRAGLLRIMLLEEKKICPRSLSEIARELGVDRSTLVFAQPDLTDKITKNYRERSALNRMMFRSIRHHAYREAAILIAQHGQLPTRNRVMELLENVPVFALNDRMACQSICYEVREDFGLRSRR